jgi:hypothetical protein
LHASRASQLDQVFEKPLRVPQAGFDVADALSDVIRRLCGGICRFKWEKEFSSKKKLPRISCDKAHTKWFNSSLLRRNCRINCWLSHARRAAPFAVLTIVSPIPTAVADADAGAPLDRSQPDEGSSSPAGGGAYARAKRSGCRHSSWVSKYSAGSCFGGNGKAAPPGNVGGVKGPLKSRRTRRKYLTYMLCLTSMSCWRRR